MNIQKITIILSVIVNVLLIWSQLYWGLLIATPLLLLVIYDVFQKKHTILNLYPIAGHLRYLFESIRPEIQQYFVESNISGRPINREFRALVYQRAKQQRDTRPFGTQFDVYRSG